MGLVLISLHLFEEKPKQSEIDIETYIKSKVAKEDVVPDMIPATIHYRRPDMTKEDFCAVGTIYTDKHGNPQIITAEHIFRVDVPSASVMSVRALRGSVDPPVTYIGSIVATGEDLGGPTREERDIVIASLVVNPTVIKPYSNFVHTETAQSFWGDVVIGRKKISRLRSLVSGEYVEVVGYSRRSEGKSGSTFVIINCCSRSGESGTGYVDDFGGLWVLHGGSSSKEIEDQAVAECEKVTGKKVVGISIVSGPLFGQYK